LYVKIITVQQASKFDEKKRGENNPTLAEINKCRVFNQEWEKSGADVTIIVGKPIGNTQSKILLLMRFYHFDNDLNSLQVRQMTEDIYNILSHGGYEARRQGGSSGICRSYDKQMSTFVNVPGNIPRKGKGVKFLTTKLGWKLYYIRRCSGYMNKNGKEGQIHKKTHGGTVAMCLYTPPKRGGAFRMTKQLFHKYKFLFTEFARKKMFAVLILSELNMQIQPFAVENELSLIKKAREELGNYSSERNNTGSKFDKIRIEKSERGTKIEHARLYYDYNKVTLITHPVGYHRDSYGKGNKQGFENRLCLVSADSKKNQGLGRGGAGPNKYVIALLDWTSS
jgi:hypothetical protein